MPSYYYDCGTPAVTDPAGAEQTGGIFRPWSLYETDYALPAGATHLSTTHRIHVEDAWGNAEGYYLKSHNRLQKDADFAISPWFYSGKLFVENAHTFQHFAAAGTWAKAFPAGSTFYVENLDFDEPLSVVEDLGGSYRFTVGADKGLFKCSLPWRPFAYRFYHFPWWSDGAHTIRIGAGRRPASIVPYAPAYYWEYAWEFEVEAGWQILTLDIMHPNRVSTVTEVGTTGATVSDDAFSGQRHPVQFLDGSDSATTLWLELPVGIYEAEPHEGYLDGTLSTERALLYHGIQNTGDSTPLESYEPGAAPLDLLSQYLTYVANGARGFVITQIGASISNFWSALRALLSDDAGRDTGFTVTPLAHSLAAQPAAGNCEFQPILGGAPYGEVMFPSSIFDTHVLHKIRRPSALGLPGYYGMGDPVTGIYDSVHVLKWDTLWGGEARGVLRTFTLGGTVEIYDNPTGTLVSTAYLQDDGSFRAVYGPGGEYRPRSNSSAALSSGDPQEYAGSPPVYTSPIGERFNAYWIKAPGGTGLDTDEDGYLLQDGARVNVVLLDGYATWFPFILSAVGRRPGTLQDWLGRYHRLESVSGKIRYRRSDFAVPPWAIEQDISTGPTDTYPRVALDKRERLHVIFGRSSGAGNAVEVVSDSDGEAFDAPLLLWSAVKYPTIGHDPVTGLLVRAAYSGGSLVGLHQWPGETAPLAVTFLDPDGDPLAVADDSFHLAALDEFWYMAVRLAGPDVVSLMRRPHDEDRWEVLTTLLAGGRWPTLAVGPGRELVVAARVGTGIDAAVMQPGEALPGVPFTFRDALGAALVVANDGFALAGAVETERRGLLAAVIGAEVSVSDWVSANEWEFWERVS